MDFFFEFFLEFGLTLGVTNGNLVKKYDDFSVESRIRPSCGIGNWNAVGAAGQGGGRRGQGAFGTAAAKLAQHQRAVGGVGVAACTALIPYRPGCLRTQGYHRRTPHQCLRLLGICAATSPSAAEQSEWCECQAQIKPLLFHPKGASS
jgi:hypothetical protein